MKGELPSRLISYLKDCGVLQSKRISVDSYEISFDYAPVPVQGDLFGDCGVWVCLFLYRLCHNLPLMVENPVQAALAYRERMLDYFWKHRVEVKWYVIVGEHLMNLVIIMLSTVYAYENVCRYL